MGGVGSVGSVRAGAQPYLGPRPCRAAFAEGVVTAFQELAREGEATPVGSVTVPIAPTSTPGDAVTVSFCEKP